MEPIIFKIVITQTMDENGVTREVEFNGKKTHWDKVHTEYHFSKSRPKTILDEIIDFGSQSVKYESRTDQSEKTGDVTYNSSYFFSLFGKRWFNFFNFKKKIFN